RSAPRRKRQGGGGAARGGGGQRSRNHRVGARPDGGLQGATGGRVPVVAAPQRQRQGAVARAPGRRERAGVVSTARRQPIVENTGWRWGPFTLRLPFLHTRPHWPEIAQGLLVAT